MKSPRAVLPPAQLLPLAVAPVLLASGAAAQVSAFAWPEALLALGVSLALLAGSSAVDARGAAWVWPLVYFVTFGPVVTLGTLYVLSGQISWRTAAGAAGVGMLAAATRIVATLRDRPANTGTGDSRATAAAPGDTLARWLYTSLVAGAFVAALVVAAAEPWALLALVVAGGAVVPTRTVLSGRMGRGLLSAWRDTAAITLYYAAALTIGMLLSR